MTSYLVNQEEPGDVIFLDFSKAFDSVFSQDPSGKNIQHTAV